MPAQGAEPKSQHWLKQVEWWKIGYVAPVPAPSPSSPSPPSPMSLMACQQSAYNCLQSLLNCQAPSWRALNRESTHLYCAPAWVLKRARAIVSVWTCIVRLRECGNNDGCYMTRAEMLAGMAIKEGAHIRGQHSQCLPSITSHCLLTSWQNSKWNSSRSYRLISCARRWCFSLEQ